MPPDTACAERRTFPGWHQPVYRRFPAERQDLPGPAFNITVDEAKEGDVTETINDITLIAEEKLVDEFGGFRLLSSEENGGRGLSLKPVIEVEGGCGSCGGGCHH